MIDCDLTHYLLLLGAVKRNNAPRGALNLEVMMASKGHFIGRWPETKATKRPHKRASTAQALMSPPVKKPVVKTYPCQGRELFLITLYRYNPSGDVRTPKPPDDLEVLAKMGYRLEGFESVKLLREHHAKEFPEHISFRLNDTEIFRLPWMSGSRMKNGVQWWEWSETYLCSRK